jgi:argininosuccinate lyase
LVRAKTGRINGSLIALLTVMKGLPLAYSKDMQEDKEQVFDAAESLELAVAAMTGMVRDMVIRTDRMKAATDEIFGVLTVEASVASRKSYGGTAPAEVRKQIAWWRSRN